MQLHLLHLDDAFAQQHDFLARCEEHHAHHLRMEEEGSAVRLWGKTPSLNALVDRLRDGLAASDEPNLCFMGSGDFHHVSALLIEAMLARQTQPVTIIHFDNHPDWVRFEGGMHCGSWVNRAAAHPSVARVVTIGVTSHDLRNPDWKGANMALLRDGALELFPYDHAPSRVRHEYGAGASHQQIAKHVTWQTIAQLGEEAFGELLLSRIPTEAVYITVDKDVLSREDVETNWDQGQMRLDYLLRLLQKIGAQHRIIGADVTGDYSPPRYSGSQVTRFMKHAEIFLDQPHAKRDRAAVATLNGASNLALLSTFQEVMA